MNDNTGKNKKGRAGTRSAKKTERRRPGQTSGRKPSHEARRNSVYLQRAFLFMLIVAVVFGGIAAVSWNRQRRFLDVPVPYSLTEMNGAAQLSDFALQKTVPYTSDLVVSEANVNTDLVSLEREDENALLFNLQTNEAEYAYDIYRRIYPASITKVMTAMLAIEHADMSQYVTMQPSDFAMDEDAQMSELQEGDVVTMQQLFELLVVYSANDAALAIARVVGGSTDNFVDMMNAKAVELGMTGTHFVNPHGLHDENHYTTCYDVYLMMNAAYKMQAFNEAAQQMQITVNYTDKNGQKKSFLEYSTDEFITTNYTLPRNVRILASKTGTTGEAGSCLALAVQNNYGVPYIAIVMGAWYHEELYSDMLEILLLVNAE